LSLHKHPYIEQKVAEAMKEYGTGGHGVRTLSGSTVLHEALERKTANFKSTEDAVTFSSGYICNISTIVALVGPGDTILTDHLNHGSIVDGCIRDDQILYAAWYLYTSSTFSYCASETGNSSPFH